MTEKFQNGDDVEVWDSDYVGAKKYRATYFAYDDMSLLPCGRHFALPKGGYSVDRWRHCRKARPHLEMDAPLWVRHHATCPWLKRHFAGWSKSGLIKAWSFGTTSHTGTAVKHWEYYSITEPEPE